VATAAAGDERPAGIDRQHRAKPGTRATLRRARGAPV